MLAVLTPEQKTQLKQLRDEWKASHPHAGHRQGGAGGNQGTTYQPNGPSHVQVQQTSTETPTPIPAPAH